jgi:asparagine synthase (glutamine-hydrolysing)
VCGIIGIVSRSPVDGNAWLTKGRDAMTHRGPDDAGEYWSSDRRVGLGHRRLAIIDLSSSGHQPMADTAGTVRIVFNGEIYNFGELRAQLERRGHALRSHSDTEVILAAYREWGTSCLSRLNGMFAFALYDAERQVVLLARDRAGEKPLYYRLVDDELRFASELKGLLADPAIERRIDSDALDCYLAVGYVGSDRCILRGFRKLPPAHALTFDLSTGHTQVFRYWTLPTPIEAPSNGDGSDQALLEELDALLEGAVRRQLIADVPIGLLLSGGVDSSLVTAMAARASSRVRTFTIGFPHQLRFDETAHARLVAEHFGTLHTTLVAEPATADLLPALARQFDEPMVDSSMIPTFLVSRLVREHCTVALGGDGGDELFGGYPHYQRMLWMQRRCAAIPIEIRRSISRAASLLPVGTKGRNWLQSLGCDWQRGLPFVNACFDPSTRQSLMGGPAQWPTVAEADLADRIPIQTDLLQRATRMDFNNYLAEDILVKVDRSSMLSSLEVRAPFLDQHLIEFAFAKVPSRLKATASDKKILLKRLTQRVLPVGFDRQRKQGFSIPLADWLRDGAFRHLFNDVLLDSRCLFDRKVVDDLLRGQDRGRGNQERLFSLALFELWRREYEATL